MSNIRVAVRVRPLSNKEQEDGSQEIVQVKENVVRIENIKVRGVPEFGDTARARARDFTFDHVYDSVQGNAPCASQAQVFNDLGAEVLHNAFGGFNACVFAYGQTGSGKTHTMMGYPGDVGLIPRICEGLFEHIQDSGDDHVTSRIDISYFEIYNERVRDLLQPDLLRQNENYSLKVREHPKEGPYVKGLSWHRVKNNEEIQALLEKGNEHRVTAETYMHDQSSRSHAIVTINFTQARLEENRPSEIVSKINLVDLAGSERADPSSKPDFRKRLTEGANINKSLVTLGYVIKTLAERSLLSWETDDMGSLQSFSGSGGGESQASSTPSGPNKQRMPYIPYRDSVLTWLLKDSLGGNAKTIMIATITPASQYYSESISTLRYAQRAKNIINKPHINEDSNVALIRELRKEIGRLHGMLASAQKAGTIVSLPEADNADIAEKLHENEEMESDLSIRGLRNRSSSMGVMIDSQLPYLVGMDDDVLSTGIVIFHLKEGETLLGRGDADAERDIVLEGPGIETEHCVIENATGEVILRPGQGALCSVNGQECTQPTKLSQGDYVILGGNQVFRFNNPAEAAKLRENRQSQGSLNTLGVGYPSYSGLSRASSYSSIGGDDSNYLSPQSQLARSYPNRDLERRYQSEQERIEQARTELEQLKSEHERAEEARQLREEEMYAAHEQHRADIEDQKHQLARLVEENERAREKAEEELQLARESLAKEREASNF
ncbi:kinesin-like protein KIF16B [Mya arenaria]|uniref:kinesin-like protein KIF16B n=1 Tax=Mya arenaria TaxID=6604 RepID=UPI0022E62D3A|nr:kinesin-like protein KIF16B [Mya arenaria]